MFRFPRGAAATPLPVPEADRDVQAAGAVLDSPEEAEDSVASEPQEYKAFHAVADNQQVEALWLRCGSGQEHVLLDYAWRRMVRYDGFGCALTLVFTDCTVKILGQKLNLLLAKLQNRKVEWVQLYEPDRWLEPDPRAAIVTAIALEFASEVKEEPAPRLRLVEKGE